MSTADSCPSLLPSLACRPFWLSPRQVLIVPVSQPFIPFARSVGERLYQAGFFADVEDSTKTMNKKVREGQLAQYNFIFVVGQAEQVGSGEQH